MSERLLDLSGTLRFLGSVQVRGFGGAGLEPGRRLQEASVTEHTSFDPKILFEIGTVEPTAAAAAPKNAVEWVDTPEGLRAAAAALRELDVVGLDVETTLDFAVLCLIQVAAPDRTYLIDPLALGDLEPLARVLRASKPVKVIHNARFERRVLASMGIALGEVFDTLEVSRMVRGRDALGGHSLAVVCERELGVALDKGAQTSMWTRRPLDPEQIRYAALDAEVLLSLHTRLGELGIGANEGDS